MHEIIICPYFQQNLLVQIIVYSWLMYQVHTLICTLGLLIFSYYCHRRLVTRLASHEILRRQHGAYTSDALILMNNYDYSNDKLSLSQQDIEDLAVRFQVGKSIITFNADRLHGICYSLLKFNESVRQNIRKKRYRALRQSLLNSKQMAIALEFYLQIDGESSSYLYILLSCMFIFFSGHILYENLFVSWSRTSINDRRSILWKG